MNEWDKCYLCYYCDLRFGSYPELMQHLMDEHGFIPTKYSHTARYWRHWYHPLSDSEKKLWEIHGIITRDPIYQYLPANMEEAIKDIMRVLNIE